MLPPATTTEAPEWSTYSWAKKMKMKYMNQETLACYVRHSQAPVRGEMLLIILGFQPFLRHDKIASDGGRILIKSSTNFWQNE